jgi:4-amino-4-deoxy-L-arabinose transferase-like glycosyltransferase
MRQIRAALGRRPLALLVTAQIAAVAVVGGVSAFRFHIFAGVDELPHISYVQEIAEHGALPWLGRTYIPWQMEAIARDSYPRPAGVDPRTLGLVGESYEAFQPPLYYLLAVPAFAIPSNYRSKVIAVRLFDLLLLAVAVAVLALLARAIFARRWLAPYAVALAVLLWPGIIVRSITVSNEALELPLALLYVLACWRASTRPNPRALLAAGALLGLCLLTAMTLLFLAPLLALPLLRVLGARRDRAALIAAGMAALLPLLMLAPWLASNEARYGALTANSLAKQIQAPYVNPTGQSYGLGAVASRLGRLDRAVLPEEWWPAYAKPALALLLRALPAILLAAALVPALRRPRLLLSRAALLLAAPVPLAIVMLAAIVVLADWPSFMPRYLNAAFPLLALFACWALARLRPGERVMVTLALGGTLAAAFVWVYMAGAYYFTHVGAALGIHA